VRPLIVPLDVWSVQIFAPLLDVRLARAARTNQEAGR